MKLGPPDQTTDSAVGRLLSTLMLALLSWPDDLPAATGFVGSKHDFSIDRGSNDMRICIYCHTPSGAQAASATPQWKKLPGGEVSRYRRYADMGTVVLDVEEPPVGSVSLSCLSCHDGTQAPDVAIETHAKAQGRGILPPDFVQNDELHGHPVHVDYASGACRGHRADCDPRQLTRGAVDFNPLSYAEINGMSYWWVNNQAGTPLREKSDLLLYGDQNSREKAGRDDPKIECATCHDPHNASSQPVSFLRVDNRESQLCQVCHIK